MIRVYLRAKFEVSTMILTGFKQGVIPPPSPTSKQPPKKLTQIRVKKIVCLCFIKDSFIQVRVCS